MAQIVNVVVDKSYRPTVSHIPHLEQFHEVELAWRLPRSMTWTYILKAEKVAVMAILANKNWRKKCVNLDKTKIATKVRKS